MNRQLEKNIKLSSNHYFYLLSAFVLILLYGQVIFFDYVWDDKSLLLYDDRLVIGSLSWDLIARPVLEDTSYFRPFVFLSWFFEFHLLGRNPMISHAVNLVAFYFSVITLFHLACHLLKSKPFTLTVSWFITFIYLCHPMNVEAVAWVSGRFDVFATFFIFVACYVFLVAKNNKARIVIVSLCYMCALGSKEIGILLAPAMFCLWMMATDEQDTKSWLPKIRFFVKSHLLLLIVLSLITICYLVIRSYYASGLVHKPYDWAFISKSYFTDFLPIVATKEYLVRTLLPLFNLGAFLPNSYFTQTPNIIISWIVIALLLSVMLVLLRNRVTVFFAILGYLLMLSLVIYIIPITIGDNIVQDRFLMSALPFYCLCVGYFICWLLKVYTRKWMIFTFSGLYLILLSLITNQLVPNWENEFKFWYMANHYQKKYTDETHPMYFRELILNDQRKAVEEIIEKENEFSRKTGKYRLNYHINYAQYLVKLGEAEGMVLTKEFKRLLLSIGNDYKRISLNRSYVFAVYQSYVLGSLTIDYDLEAAEGAIGYVRQFAADYNLRTTVLYEFVISALSGQDEKAKLKLQELVDFSSNKLKADLVKADDMITKFCNEKSLSVTVCKPSFSTKNWLLTDL